MQHIIIEIKARTDNPSIIRNILLKENPKYIGKDRQVDTYFNSKNGRLKLREGNIENTLIHYNRENKQGPKQSNVLFYKPNPDSLLKQILPKLSDCIFCLLNRS